MPNVAELAIYWQSGELKEVTEHTTIISEVSLDVLVFYSCENGSKSKSMLEIRADYSCRSGGRGEV